MERMHEPKATLITSRSEFLDAVRCALREAADTSARFVFLSDPDFAQWPLNEREVVDALGQWAHSNRALTLLANHFDVLSQRHPRWVAWRRNWSHVVNCQQTDEADSSQLSTQLLIPGQVVVRLVDTSQNRGSVSRKAADLLGAQEVIDALLQRSQPSFPATTLGL